MWKVEFINKLEYWLEEISKETGEGMTWFPLAAYSKMWDDQFNQWTAALTYTHDLQTAYGLPFLQSVLLIFGLAYLARSKTVYAVYSMFLKNVFKNKPETSSYF